MSEQGVVFLEGFKTILRPFDKSTDLEPVTRWINDPDVRRFLKSYMPKSRRQEEEWFDRHGTNDSDVTLAVVEKEGGQLIGSMGLHRIIWRERRATTGAMIGDKRFWGKGFGTDAKMALLEYAFHELNLYKICSSAYSFNKRSIAYSLHCGYQVEGIRRRHLIHAGRYWDQVELGLFKSEWLPIWRRWKKTGSVK